MEPLFLVVSLLCFSSVLGLILPMTKTDGTLDVSSLMSHIALLEQSMENKASATEVEQMKTDLVGAMKDLAVSKSEVTRLASDLAASQKELADTKTKLTQVESKLAEVTKTNSYQDLELKEVKADLKTAQIEIALFQNQKVNSSGLGISQTSPIVAGLKSDVSRLQTDVSHLQKEFFQLQSVENGTAPKNSVAGGTVFTRWGRTSCPADSNIIYKGYTGGNWYRDKASSASIVCLPDQPIYANHTDAGHFGDSSHIYGTEYEINYIGAPFWGFANEDMPCVACESRSRNSVMMIPGRNQCYSGWTLEYWGYLMGPYSGYASGEYICVDSDAEAIPGGYRDTDGQLMYPVEGRCGALACPPYHDTWELTCAVCSK